MKEELNYDCTMKRKTYTDHWLDCFPMGLLTSLLIVLFNAVYVFVTDPAGKDKEVMNIFYSLSAISILNPFITPMLCAFVLILKDRLNIKFKFRQTYKFK